MKTTKTNNSLFFKTDSNKGYRIHLEYFWENEETCYSIFENKEKKFIESDCGEFKEICKKASSYSDEDYLNFKYKIKESIDNEK